MHSHLDGRCYSQESEVICAYRIPVVKKVLLDQFLPKLSQDGVLISLRCHCGKQIAKTVLRAVADNSRCWSGVEEGDETAEATSGRGGLCVYLGRIHKERMSRGALLPVRGRGEDD